MKFKLLFFLLCILTLTLVIIKLYKINEKFVNDFDEVMDNKCMIVTNNQKDNYVFNRGVCEKNTCPLELCSYLRLNTRTGENHYMSELAPKYSSNDADGNFTCVTKESLPDKVYCETMPPTCEYLGAEDFCYVYNNNTWDKQEYKKILTSSGDCVWKNKFTNNEYMDGSFLEECRKTPLNCSLCNLPCSTGFNKYQTFSVASNVNGLFCEQDPAVCGEGCEPLSKTGYKLNSTNRQYEPILFRQQTMRNSACVYVYVDQYGNEYCHPDHKGEVFTNYTCQFHDDIISELNTEIKSCYTNDYKWCCNLDDRDMFEKTKYEPVISRDGESCVYRSVDRSLSRELEMDTINGFNCPGYEFRLCQKQDEFRNVFEQKCTPCPIGTYIRDNTQMTAYDACAPVPDCSSNIDYCYENINDLGTIKKKVGYKQRHQIQYSDDGGLNIATCVSTTPSDCIRECNKPLVIADQGVFCDLCATEDNPELEINPNTLKCSKKVPCESLNNICLDKRYNKFNAYTLTQDDEFSPCLYKKVDNETDTLNPLECLQECPPNYIKSGDPTKLRAGDKCEIPKCSFTRNVTINNPLNVPSFNNLDDDTKNTIFEQIDTNDAYRYHKDFCKINTISRIVELSSDDGGSTVCKITSDSEILPEVAHLVDQNQLYSIPYTLNVEPRQKQGTRGTDCPSDCTYANPVYKNGTDHRVCTDRVNNRTSYGPGEDIQGTLIKTSMKTGNHNRFGKTCPQAKAELLGRINETSYELNDKGDRLEFSYLCGLPKKNIDCKSREICTNCEDRGTCSFKKTCHVVIDTHPFGNGTACPPTTPRDKNCPQTCPNCLNVSEWDISNYVWDNIQPSPTEDKTYTRSLITTQNCLYNSSPKGPNQNIDTQVKTINRPPLTQTEIDNVCGDTLYNWTPTLEQICSCTDESTAFFTQRGSLNSSPAPVVRGLTLACPSAKSKEVNCSEHYNSTSCKQEREILDDRVRSAGNTARSAADNLETIIRNLETAIINGTNTSIVNTIITTATHIKNMASNLINNTRSSANAIDDLFRTYPPVSNEIKNDTKDTVEENTNSITTMIQTVNNQIDIINNAIRETNIARETEAQRAEAQRAAARQAAALEAAAREEEAREAAETDRSNYCKNINNWNLTDPTCPTHECYRGGMIDKIINNQKSHNVYSCAPGDIENSVIPKIDCPSTQCPSLLGHGFYRIKTAADDNSYLGRPDANTLVNRDNAIVFYLGNPIPPEIITLTDMESKKLLMTEEVGSNNFKFTENEYRLRIEKITDSNFKIYSRKNNNDNDYTHQIIKNNNQANGFIFEQISYENICKDPSNYVVNECPIINNCSESTETIILHDTFKEDKYRTRSSCPSGISPPSRSCVTTYACIQINEIHTTQSDLTLTINSITINDTTLSDFSEKLYLEIQLENDRQTFITSNISISLQNSNNDGNAYIIELNNNTWSILNGKIERKPGKTKFKVTFNKLGSYKLHMGLTRKNSNGMFINDNGSGYTKSIKYSKEIYLNCGDNEKPNPQNTKCIQCKQNDYNWDQCSFYCGEEKPSQQGTRKEDVATTCPLYKNRDCVTECMGLENNDDAKVRIKVFCNNKNQNNNDCSNLFKYLTKRSDGNHRDKVGLAGKACNQIWKIVKHTNSEFYFKYQHVDNNCNAQNNSFSVHNHALDYDGGSCEANNFLFCGNYQIFAVGHDDNQKFKICIKEGNSVREVNEQIRTGQKYLIKSHDGKYLKWEKTNGNNFKFHSTENSDRASDIEFELYTNNW